MARVAKDPEVRRQELLDAAMALFLERGAEGTSVSAIVRRVGVAQGTFYYHFEGKDALLDELARRFAEPVGAAVSAIAGDEDVSVPVRIQHIVEVLVEAMRGSQEHLSGLLRPGNEDLHNRVGAALQAHLRPTLTSLVSQGHAAGVLDASPTGEIVELMLAAIFHLTWSHAEAQPADRLDRLADALRLLVTRTLLIRSNP